MMGDKTWKFRKGEPAHTARTGKAREEREARGDAIQTPIRMGRE